MINQMDQSSWLFSEKRQYVNANETSDCLYRGNASGASGLKAEHGNPSGAEPACGPWIATSRLAVLPAKGCAPRDGGMNVCFPVINPTAQVCEARLNSSP
jgi:hypothetical protein